MLGASAGGVEALGEVVAGLPPELPAAVLVVLHVLPSGTSVLPQILGRRGTLPVAAASDGDRIERGRVYVAPPDCHMLIQDGRVRLTHGPRENGHRPAVDPLFRSAARVAGSRVIGVILSGALDDGVDGLHLIKERGGATIAQDPADALYPSMPRSAIEARAADRVAPVARIAGLICELIDDPLGADAEVQPEIDPPSEPDRSDRGVEEGTLTALTCPECGGALWEDEEGGLARYRCHVGHAYSPVSLETSQSEALEGALWAALRSLQERAGLYRRLARRAGGTRPERLLAKADECEHNARLLRPLVVSVGRQPDEEAVS